MARALPDVGVEQVIGPQLHSISLAIREAVSVRGRQRVQCPEALQVRVASPPPVLQGLLWHCPKPCSHTQGLVCMCSAACVTFKAFVLILESQGQGLWSIGLSSVAAPLSLCL